MPYNRTIELLIVISAKLIMVLVGRRDLGTRDNVLPI